jgi:DNA-binding NtrC family response regulator
VDIRVIATTNRSLLELVSEGKFRSDLYYRLNVIPLTIPPLRLRTEDIPDLVEHFAKKHAGGRLTPPRFSSAFTARLQKHSWPGNVRELENLLRRVLALYPGDEIGEEALEGAGIESDWEDSSLRAGLSLREVEKKLLELTLQATMGNRSRAAELLGVSIRTIRNKIRDYELPRRYA